MVQLLVDGHYASTEWGKDLMKALSDSAKKAKAKLHIAYDPLEIEANGSFVFLAGVHDDWLKKCETIIREQCNFPVAVTVPFSTDAIRSSILFDQEQIIWESVSLLRSHKRNRIALVGIHRNDMSDCSKEKAFGNWCDSADICYFDESISECVNDFLARVHKYDGIICSNDIIAVYLLKRLAEIRVQVPDDVQIIGNGNLWLGQYCSLPLTTFSYDNTSIAKLIIRFSKMFSAFSDINAFDIKLKTVLIERESTGVRSFAPQEFMRNSDLHLTERYLSSGDPDFYMLSKINSVFSACYPEEIQIASMLLNGSKYDDIAEAVALSVDSVKYQIKKLYACFDIHSRNELCEILEHYNVKIV